MGEYANKAVYFDRRTQEMLEAPKSKLLDTEKSARMNRHIPLMVVVLMSSGGGIASFFTLFIQGTYTPRLFWLIMTIWLAEFTLIVGLVERALYKNVRQASLMTQANVTYFVSDEKGSEDVEENGSGALLFFRAIAFVVFMASLGYAYHFIFIKHNTLIGKPIGADLFKFLPVGVLFGVTFVLYNQNSFVRDLKFYQHFEEGKLRIICKESDEDDTLVEVSTKVERTIVSEKIEKSRRQTR